MRHPLLYADQVWRRQRFFIVVLLVFPVAMVLSLVVARRPADPTLGFYLLYLLLALAIFGGFQLNRMRSYVQVTESGLKVSRLIRTIVIDWDQVRAVRIQPLRSVLQDFSRRSVTPPMKELLDRPALVVRLTGDPEEIAQIGRRLRSTLATRLLFDSTLALPVKDPDGLLSELSPHVPIRVQGNLGGAKRPKRKR